MSPTRRDEPEATTTTLAEEDDAEDPRTFVHDSADAVRNGELSAAQLPGGSGNVDPNEPDAQYPPGVIDTTALYDLRTGQKIDPAQFVPERRSTSGAVNTAATPDYGTDAKE